MLSSQGWNIPRVTQFRRITVIVRRSNQLQRKKERKKMLYYYTQVLRYTSTYMGKHLMLESPRRK